MALSKHKHIKLWEGSYRKVIQDDTYYIKNEIHSAYFIPGYNAMRH